MDTQQQVSDQDVAEWTALLEGITPGKWHVSRYTACYVSMNGQVIADCSGDRWDRDAQFIAAAPSIVRRLLADRRARGSVAEAGLAELHEKWDTAVAHTAGISQRLSTTPREAMVALSDQCYASNEYIAALESALAQERAKNEQHQTPF